MKNYNAPWRIMRDCDYTDNPEDVGIASIEDSKGQTVLYTDSGYFKPEEDYAKLIEQAPALLQAATDLLAVLANPVSKKHEREIAENELHTIVSGLL